MHAAEDACGMLRHAAAGLLSWRSLPRQGSPAHRSIDRLGFWLIVVPSLASIVEERGIDQLARK
jgi:hypothetical protein